MRNSAFGVGAPDYLKSHRIPRLQAASWLRLRRVMLHGAVVDPAQESIDIGLRLVEVRQQLGERVVRVVDSPGECRDDAATGARVVNDTVPLVCRETLVRFEIVDVVQEVKGVAQVSRVVVH
jgi:hypothetical protein